jgi:hypothetical protein
VENQCKLDQFDILSLTNTSNASKMDPNVIMAWQASVHRKGRGRGEVQSCNSFQRTVQLQEHIAQQQQQQQQQGQPQFDAAALSAILAMSAGGGNLMGFGEDMAGGVKQEGYQEGSPDSDEVSLDGDEELGGGGGRSGRRSGGGGDTSTGPWTVEVCAWHFSMTHANITSQPTTRNLPPLHLLRRMST